MKLQVLSSLLLCNSLSAQVQLEFNKNLIECEDRWVAYTTKDSSFNFGFIYIDQRAGPTMQYGGNFTIADNGRFQLNTKSQIKENIKVRLMPTDRLVAIIPESKLTELQLPVLPDWLSSYKSDTISAKHFYTWGFIYNEWNKPALALTFLEKAQQNDSSYPGLASELAYTYNALGKHQNALTVLNSTKEKTCYDYKELTYALIKLGQLAEADAKCIEAISNCSDKKMKAEIAFNMAGEYYHQKDKSNYKIWSKETKKWAEANDFFFTNIRKMDDKISK